MSFTFGQPATTTTASAFGTNTLSGGNLFGGGDAKTFQSPGQNTDNKASFFSNPTTSAPAFSSFSFGAKTTAATPGFFASPTTTAASTAFGSSKPLSFGGFTSPPNQTVGSPGFGQPAAQNAPQNLSFGQTTITQQQAPPAFGTPTTQAPPFGSPSNSSFSLAKPATQQTTSSFSFTPTSGFSIPQQPAATTTAQQVQSSFSLTPATTSASGFAQSTPSFGQMFGKSSFSFAPTTSATGTIPSTTTSAAPAFGLTTAPSFGLGQQSTPNLGQTQTTTTTGFQFGQATATGFGASQPIASQPIASQPIASQPIASQPIASQPIASQPIASQPIASQPIASQPIASQPTVNQAQPKLGFAQSTATSQNASQQSALLMFGGGGLSKPAVSTTGTFITPISSTPQTTSAPMATSSFGVTTVTSGFGASTVTTSGVSFGVPSVTSTAVSQTPKTNTGLTFTGPSGGLSFSKPASTTATSSTATSAPTGILSLGKSTATSTMPSLTTTTTTTASAPPQPISSITFAQLEENINKWTLELEEQEKIFINQATQINAWDRLLISNGEMIVELNDTIQTVNNEQQSLEHELDFVLAQQKELEEILTPIEKKLLNEMGDRLRDPEREHMYSLAENLDSQLRQMSEDLKEVIEHLNETNRSQDTNDPIVQIGRILNAHMSSMQWIDNSIAQISTKLDQLKATHDTLRRDNERSFQLTYN